MTGDDDLPQREALHERRAKYDSVKARQSALDDSDGEVQPGGSKRPRAQPRELDDTYVAAAEAALAKKRARKDLYKIPDLAPPLPDDPADGARGINTVRAACNIFLRVAQVLGFYMAKRHNLRRVPGAVIL